MSHAYRAEPPHWRQAWRPSASRKRPDPPEAQKAPTTCRREKSIQI